MLLTLLPLFAVLAIAAAFGSVAGWMVACATAALGFLIVAILALLRINRIRRFIARDGASPLGNEDELVEQLHKQQRALELATSEAIAQRESVQLAVRLLPDAVIVLDEAQRVVWCNDAAQTLLRVENRAERRSPISEWVRDHAILELLQNPDDSALTLPSPVTPDHVLALSTIRCDATTRVLVAQDVTDFKRLEAVRRDFIANLSHELKTPLTVIAGFSENLLSDAPMSAAQKQRGLEHIKAQADNMRRLVLDLLLLSRLESTSTPAEKQFVALTPLVARCVEQIRSLSRGQQRIEILPSEPWLLLGREDELESALNNLLTNAMKYSGEAGLIQVETRAHADQSLQLSVRDNGQGIAPDHVPRLTERFYRVDRGRSRAAGGTGLGLAIVKHIMNRHGGRLEIASTLGIGSAFSLKFPPERVRKSAAGSTDAARSSSTMSASPSKTAWAMKARASARPCRGSTSAAASSRFNAWRPPRRRSTRPGNTSRTARPWARPWRSTRA